ncbi:phosphonate C-P lyase system protein PhnH [Synechococcus sp. PCC 7335]|uniref:phosphonate C-P lyase system protein PhnH n=1 Tax=Synechococcus sp. (strain ATCC 29403 / PCC 7335) TaxID=91464 RepID=UPI00017EE7F3|nr:phosphonate C-P lyase system protein PhnH [Synechococcus sp. PCC 7335]EDX87252.1 phosphonate C-P lyase system protein PhnH [Synechococcus sp. PCC 7335]
MSAAILPGFQDTVHDAQCTFKNLLEALSHPGRPYRLRVDITAPDGLTPICAAACLSLVDIETAVWLQPSLPTSVRNWLRFHTGCRFTTDPSEADFAVVANFSSEIDLSAFNWGSAECPERSTTLLVQVKGLDGGESKQLNGPGILGSLSFSPRLPAAFWKQWPENNTLYPRGLDCFMFAHDSVAGLPRTTHVHS